MIAYLEGKLLESTETSAIILCGGVGYRVFMTEEALKTLEKDSNSGSVSLFTHLAVRENSQDLYGFISTEELNFFELLLGVSGIGPKSALSILNIAPLATLESAVLENNSNYLTKVSGIGAKSAQKIVLELQGKIAKRTGETTNLNDDEDTLEALKALGYREGEVRGVIKDLPKDLSDTNARIKEALRLLGK